VFFIVKRGKCSDFQRIKNIEKAGGKLAIIIEMQKETKEIVQMSHAQSQVHIPAVTVDHETGLKLTKAYGDMSNSEQKQLLIMVSFETNRKDDRVEYDIWMTSMNNKGLQFVEDFYRLHSLFGDHVLFQPRFYTWSCPL